MAIIYDLSSDDYHASDRVSASKLRDFITRGPRLFHQRYISKTVGQEEKDAFTFGHAFEGLLCHGPRWLDDNFLVKPTGKEGDGRTKEGKTWKERNGTGEGDDWRPNKPMISQADRACMLNMVEAIHEHPNARALMFDSDVKQQVTLTGTICGIEVQARPDFICLKPSVHTGFTPYSLDLKTTKSMNGMTSARGIIEYGYDIQAAMVGELMRQNGYPGAVNMIAPVEKSLPHRFDIIDLDPEFQSVAAARVDSWMSRLAYCHERGEWPRSSPGIVRVAKPAWYRAENDDE